MAIETVYIVQAYVQGRGKGLKAEQQMGCKSAGEARRKAERLAPLRLGVVAFAASADTEMGDYDEDPRSCSRPVNCRRRGTGNRLRLGLCGTPPMINRCLELKAEWPEACLMRSRAQLRRTPERRTPPFDKARGAGRC